MENKETKPNDAAFSGKEMPYSTNDGSIYNTGLTKREYFAAMAMQGLLSNAHPKWVANTAEYSVCIADLLIEELNKQ